MRIPYGPFSGLMILANVWTSVDAILLSLPVTPRFISKIARRTPRSFFALFGKSASLPSKNTDGTPTLEKARMIGRASSDWSSSKRTGPRLSRSCSLLEGQCHDRPIKTPRKIDIPFVRKYQRASLRLHDLSGDVQSKSHAVGFTAYERLGQKFRRIDETWPVVSDDDSPVTVQVINLPNENSLLASLLAPFVVEPPNRVVHQVHNRRDDQPSAAFHKEIANPGRSHHLNLVDLKPEFEIKQSLGN